MRSVSITAAAALALSAGLAQAESHAVAPVYLASELMSPCQEADNDARWGEAAEVECEQYLIGYVDALKAAGLAGEGTEICPPAVNTADEVRWAFMRWVHESFSTRKRMPASDAVMATLKANFPCGG